jgi:hypothetical protein
MGDVASIPPDAPIGKRDTILLTCVVVSSEARGPPKRFARAVLASIRSFAWKANE